MHGEEIKYITKAYETNWMSTVGKNINEVERIAAEQAGVKYAVALSCCTAALHLCVKLRSSMESLQSDMTQLKERECSAQILPSMRP